MIMEVTIVKELQEKVKFIKMFKRILDEDLKAIEADMADVKQELYLQNLDWARNFLYEYSYVKKEFIVREKEVICLVGNCDGGRALCSKNDKFSFAIGKAIALARALGLEEDVPQTLK